MIKPDRFLKTIRKIILDSFQIFDDHLEFDGAKAEAAGHDPLDIAVAEKIFVNECYFTDRFKDDLIFFYSGSKLNRKPDFEPKALYVPVAKIIFVINPKEKVSACIFEENLVKNTASLESADRYFDTRLRDCKGERKKIEYKW